MQTTSGRIKFAQEGVETPNPEQAEEQTSSSGRIKFSPTFKSGFEEKYAGTGDRLSELKAKYSTDAPKKEGGFFSNVWKDLKYRGSELKETAMAYKAGEITGPEVGLRVAGDIVGGAWDIVGQGVVSGGIGLAKTLLPKSVENKIAELGKDFLESDTGKEFINAVSTSVDAYNQFKEKHPRLTENIEASLELGTGGIKTILTKAGINIGEKVGKEVVENVAEKGAKMATKAVTKAKGLAQKVAPTETALEATKKVIQGGSDDLATGVKALSQLDTTGVKSFKDLSSKIAEKISTLLKQVDDDLAQDATEYTLKDLAVKQVSKSGKEVVTDYVSQGLKGLREMYEAVGDNLRKADIDDLIEKATKVGLTRKEVNDLARRYGSEFSQKAFSKTGEPLTSVNARLFENVRSGLKDVARAGIKGQAAKQADEMVSALIKTKDLVTKTANAVNKLQSKIAKRGLLEKIGHGAAKALDTLSGGSIRGVVGGLLPRGAGYKVMNALDLEEQLPKYLEIIQKAIKSESDDEIIDILKQIKLPKATGKEIAETVVENVPKTTVKSVTKKLPKAPAVKSSATKAVKTASKVDDALIQEAKKYKSAEEFVKAQGAPVYHGTSDVNRKSFEKSGFDITKNKKGMAESPYGLFVSKDIKEASMYGKNPIELYQQGDVKILSQLDEKWTNTIGKSKNAKESEVWAKKLKEEGFDLIDSGDEQLILSPEKFKTKSQLTDIWNKAQGKGKAVIKK